MRQVFIAAILMCISSRGISHPHMLLESGVYGAERGSGSSVLSRCIVTGSYRGKPALFIRMYDYCSDDESIIRCDDTGKVCEETFQSRLYRYRIIDSRNLEIVQAGELRGLRLTKLGELPEWRYNF